MFLMWEDLGGIISQHPACHRLQQGGRAGEVTGGRDGGRSLVGLINQDKEVSGPAAAEQQSSRAPCGESVALGFPGLCLFSIHSLK